MKRRVISLILTFTLLLTLVPVMPGAELIKAQTVAAWDGETKEEPEKEGEIYQIGTAAELAWFAEYVNAESEKETELVRADAVLTADLDLGAKEWTPIGNTTYVIYAYAGTFDGQGHTVSGLKIEASSVNQGLFGTVNTGTVKNLRVEGAVSSTKSYTGGIVGKLQTGKIENCSMSGSVESTSKTSYTGGIVGGIGAIGAVITACCNYAEVAGSHAGGILGFYSNTATIEDCYNTGKINGTTRSAGIAGQLSKGTVSYCYSIGQSTNGICGFSNATITNCYYLAENTGDAESAPGGTASGYGVITDPAALLQDLNAEGSQNRFREDKYNSNNGYPVLDWQLSSAIVSIPVTVVTILGDVSTGAVLTAQPAGAEGETATNVQYQWFVSSDGETFTEIEGAAERTFMIPDTADYAGKYIKVTVSGEEGSSASAVAGPVRKSESLQLKEDTAKVQKAKETLSLDVKVIKEAGVIALPQKTEGCDIIWDSSHPSVISAAGTVTLPEENVVSVTMTARISCGEAEAAKTFTIDVWAEKIDPEQYLQKVLDSMKWDYKLLQPVFGQDTNILVKFQRVLEKKGYDGVTVTVQSTADETLISKNGKIFYPPVPEGGSFADGKQVQVVFDLNMGGKTVSYPSGSSNALLVPWDTGDVKKSLETAADAALDAELLKGDNDSLSSVITDLTLPSCIEGDKYTYGQITWTSSDESHLAVSDENRKGSADAFYQPYTGKVRQDQQQHTVTLQAVVTNPSTGVTVERSIEVTVLPMSEEQLEQTLGTMSSILDCYTPVKLTDYTTKDVLDTKAVTHDIQLVRPKDVLTAEELAALDYGKYWDYWNYKFTVSSSDTEVIEVNSFRANVYRPLGENTLADKKVTLTIRMESKNNPNLFVTKDIPVVVSHLGRSEINEALALMDAAKDGYAGGLLGDNTDGYSIIDNLTPYKEIIWNKDRSGIEYVYRYADRTNNGVLVDELPGWEEQEDWRLFRTSNKDLIANETLILNETPAEDTFVKVNSVLTDEVFGKYYEKFSNDDKYDREALAKFKQLYKQPVSAYVMVTGAGHYTKEDQGMTAEEKAVLYSSKLAAFRQELDKPIRVSFTLLGLDQKELVPRTEITDFTRGATVFDVFKKVLADHGIAYEAKGSYISSIGGLAEFAHGQESGWMYTVGDVFVNSYMNAQELSGGEDIVVKYVTDYTTANAADKNPGADKDPDADKKDETPVPSQPGTGDKKGDPSNSGGNKKTTVNSTTNKKKSKKKKTIKTLKLKKYKRGSRKITGKTLKKAKVVIIAGKKKYTVKSNKKGNFTVKLKKKLKKKMKIRVTVSKSGYRKKSKTFRVK